jgi:hypothetical protein
VNAAVAIRAAVLAAGRVGLDPQLDLQFRDSHHYRGWEPALIRTQPSIRLAEPC